MSEAPEYPVNCRYCGNRAKVIHEEHGKYRYALVRCRSFNCHAGPRIQFLDEYMPHKKAEKYAIEAWNEIHEKG